MALNQDTVDIINYTKDLDIEYNIKLFLILFLIIISLFLFWYSKKIERKNDINNLLFYLSRYITIIIIVFIPLYTFLLLRSVSVNILLDYTFILYGILLIGAFLIILWFAGEYLLYKLFGIEFKKDKVKSYREDKDYRSIR